jgi:hypothetical protein
MTIAKSMKIPKAWEATYAVLTGMTDQCCARHLNEEYAGLARYAIAALCRKRPCPLVNGNPRTWACVVLYALGQINFLSDKASKPYMTSAELRDHFGVAESTAGNRAKQVRDILGMSMSEPQWMLPSRAANHPFARLFVIHGLDVDTRA